MKTLGNILAEQRGDAVSSTLFSGGVVVPEQYEVMSLSVSYELNHIPVARIVLRDGEAAIQNFEASNTEWFVPGRELEVHVGHTSHEELLFKGVITSQQIRIRQNGSSLLILEVRDKAYRMSMGIKRRYYTHMRDSEILEEIIRSYGLEPSISPTKYVHPEMVQHGASDWDFMITRAEMNGWVCLAHMGTLMLMPPDFEQRPSFTFGYGDELLELDIKMEGRNQYQGVRAFAWDHKLQEVLGVEAREPVFPEVGNLTSAFLAEKVGEESWDLLHSGHRSPEELQAWADGKLMKNRLAKVRGRARAFGTSMIRPGQLVEIQGLGERFSGPLYVSGVKHTIGEGTWLMDLQFGLSPEWFSQSYPTYSPPASGVIPAVCGLQVGVVTQIDADPEGADRVQVRLPLIGEGDPGIWARVSTFDAGANRGAFFRPEIGDEVIVGFVNDDPRDPIVLGMMHSADKPAPIEATSPNPEKGYVAREGMKWVFQEEEKSITLQTPAGNYLKIGDVQQGLVLQDEHGNQLLLNEKGITIRSSSNLVLEAANTLEIKAQNITVEAGNNASFKGEGRMSLSSSGNTHIKGTKVFIN